MSPEKQETLVAINRYHEETGAIYDHIDKLLDNPADVTRGTKTDKSRFRAYGPDVSDILYNLNEYLVDGLMRKAKSLSRNVVTHKDEDKMDQQTISLNLVCELTSKSLEEAFSSDYPTLLAAMGERFADEAAEQGEDEAPMHMAGIFIKILAGRERWLPEIIEHLQKQIKK